MQKKWEREKADLITLPAYVSANDKLAEKARTTYHDLE